MFQIYPRNEKAMIASNSPTVLLLMINCAFFVAVYSNYTMPTPIDSSQVILLSQAEYFEENHTFAIINITEMPESAVRGVALYSTPIRMKDPATQTVASFNTSFTFREEPMNYDPSNPSYLPSLAARGDGFTFLFSSSNTWYGDAAGRFGIFAANPPSYYPKLVAVEFDSWCNNDTDPGLPQLEHVGVDVGSPFSLGATRNETHQADSCFSFVNDVLGITFWQRDVLYSWIEYDGVTGHLQVRLANTSSRPLIPLLNCTYNLYDALEEKMWIGFSGSHGDAWSVYYIYNWTFTSFGIPSEFPSSTPSSLKKDELIGGVSVGILFALLITIVAVYVYRKRKLLRALDETWDREGRIEMAGMPGFISYKHLSAATKQFSDESKLGEGGFGSVYRGVLPNTGAEVAVKKVSGNSRQGEREFLAEVQIISQLRHKNVVELIGFCRDRGKFLLAYELLPRGSLDQALFKLQSPDNALSWSLRWKIVSGTAEALRYLHEEWRQQVIHRVIKSSNIMLDENHNPKLGDFGLARLVDHQKSAATTMVAGTIGYIAPEAATGGKFTDKTDVYAFGVVALEV